jgi:SAM-dependent methyltransferase
MTTLAQRLAPRGVTYLPVEASPTRAALYSLVGRLTVHDWAVTYGDLDWEKAAAELRDPDLIYPDYYLCNRHGVHGGYLTGWQAIGWSVAAAFYGLAPLYRRLARRVAAQVPTAARIVDIGAGTGEWLMDLRALFPTAQFIAADLSPMMLAALAHRWERSGYPAPALQLLHAAGERLPLADASCDIVTALLVLHELPPTATQALFAEARRVLKPGGIFVTLDAIQQPIPLPWLNEMGVRAVAALFHEPDFRQYTHLDLPVVAQTAGFGTLHRHFYGRLPWKFQIQEAS